MRRSALLLLLVACKTASSAEQHASLTEQVQTDATLARTETRKVTQGPETITTTVEEFAWGGSSIGPSAAADAPAAKALREQQVRNLQEAGVTASPPSLLRRTVTVDQRGPVVAEAHLEAQRAAETHGAVVGLNDSQKSKQSAPAAGCALGLGLWGGLLIAAALAAGVVYLKLRKVLP